MTRGDLKAIPQLVTGSGKEQNRGKNLLTAQNMMERSGLPIKAIGSQDLFGISPYSLLYCNMEYLLLVSALAILMSHAGPVRHQAGPLPPNHAVKNLFILKDFLFLSI